MNTSQCPKFCFFKLSPNAQYYSRHSGQNLSLSLLSFASSGALCVTKQQYWPSGNVITSVTEALWCDLSESYLLFPKSVILRFPFFNFERQQWAFVGKPVSVECEQAGRVEAGWRPTLWYSNLFFLTTLNFSWNFF